MTQHRPDLLPFARYDHFGLPYHGLVTKVGASQTVALPNSTTRTWPAMPTSGETVLVRGPRAAVPTRTAAQQAADTAAGLQWVNYAILSGATRSIGGKALGENCHLYIDANAAWVISISMTPGTVATGCTAEVWLESVYGIFSDHPSDFSMTRRRLATLTWNPTEADPDSTAWSVGDVFTATYSQDGAIAIVNVFSSDSAAVSPNYFDTSAPHSWYFTNGQHDVLRIAISGTGSLVKGLVGSGISATITRPYLIGTSWSYATGTVPGTILQIAGAFRVRYAVEPDGTVVYVTRNYSVEKAQQSGFPNPITCTASDSYTFGAETITSLYSADILYYGAEWSGTITHNDNTRVCSGSPPSITCSGGSVGTLVFAGFDVGLRVAQLEPGLLLLYAVFKDRATWRVVSHYGHSRAITGDETTGEDTSWYWSVDPVGGTISSNETAEICYV